MTTDECLHMFALLHAAYPKETMTEAQIALYREILMPYSAADVRRATVLHIQKSPFFPRVSDLVGALTRSDQLDADQAWAEVLRQVRRVGYYGVPVWSHPAVADAVAALGWQTICTSDNQEADRAHFMRFYERAHDRHRDAQLTQHWPILPGVVRDGLRLIGRTDREPEASS